MNAVIYARYSSSGQREESIERQVEICKNFAQKNNYKIIDTYIDRALSGRTDKRPNFLKMISDSKTHLFDYVIVYRLDRFSRDRYDSAIYKRKLQDNNVKVLSALENITDDPNGALIESIYEGMAEFYSRELSEKVTMGMRQNANKGISNGGSIPLGIRLNENRELEIDPKTAIIVKDIFEMYASGKNMKEIVDYLNKKGYKTSAGNSFKINSLHRILTNKKYNGYYVYDDILIENAIPKLIDDNTFEKCQKRMQNNKKAPAKSKAPEEYLLTGKLFCGHCNEQMIGFSGYGKNKNKYCYYMCKSGKKKECKTKLTSKDLLESTVINETLKILTDTNIEKIAKKIVKLCEKNNSSNIRLKSLEIEQQKIEKEIENLVKVLEKGMIDDIIITRISNKKNELDIIQHQIESEKILKSMISFEEVKKFLVSFKNGNIMDIQYKRSLINVFINKIILNENKLTILYNSNNSQSEVLLNIDLVHHRGFEPRTH